MVHCVFSITHRLEYVAQSGTANSTDLIILLAKVTLLFSITLVLLHVNNCIYQLMVRQTAGHE